MTRHAAHAPTGRSRRASGRPLRMDEDVHRRAARRRAGDRLQHLPDLELLPRPVRLASPPATRSSSSRTRARCCRSPSPCRSPARCSPRPASTPTWCTLAAEEPGRGARQDPGAAPRGAGSSTSPARTAFGDWLEEQRPPGRGLHREGRRQHGRRRLDRRLRRDAAATSRFSLSPLQRPDVHHPAEPARPRRRHRHRRRATSRSTRSPPTSPRAVDEAARRRRAGGRAARRDRQRRRARPARRRRRRTATSCSRRGR